MTDAWHDIPTTDTETGDFVYAFIEIPEGSSNKFEYDKRYGVLRLDRVLYTSTHYPANYGFIPRTLADDSDPLDILVLCRHAMVPGVLMRAHVIGVVMMIDGDSIDEKVIAVSSDDPSFIGIHDISQLAPHLIDEMTHFFDVYKELEGKKTKVMTRKGRDDALAVVAKCRQKYHDAYPAA